MKDPSAFLPQLVSSAPALVIGRTVVVTSFDSGPLVVDSSPGRDDGWIADRDLAASPRVTHPDLLPSAEWDEWYVFDDEQRSALEKVVGVEVFVNYSDFDVNPSRTRPPDWDDETFRYSMDRTNRFWAQLAQLKPETFLAEGSSLTCVTMNQTGFDQATEYAASLSTSAG